MKYLTLIILLFAFNANAQSIKGKIVDIETNEGIINAHVVYPEIFKGTISDSNGVFEIKKEEKLNKLIVSCIGYKDTLLIINELSDEIVGLRKANIEIEEVSVYGKKYEEKIVGFTKGSLNGTSFGNGERLTFGWTIYFPGNTGGIVKSFGVYIKEITKSNIKMYVRFLEPDTSYKTTGFDKLHNELVVNNLKKGWNEVTLDDNYLKISENGLIVKFYCTGIEPNDTIAVSGSSKTNDYSWVSSLDYRKDFPLTIRGKDFKPVVRMKILK